MTWLGRSRFWRCGVTHSSWSSSTSPFLTGRSNPGIGSLGSATYGTSQLKPTSSATRWFASWTPTSTTPGPTWCPTWPFHPTCNPWPAFQQPALTTFPSPDPGTPRKPPENALSVRLRRIRTAIFSVDNCPGQSMISPPQRFAILLGCWLLDHPGASETPGTPPPNHPASSPKSLAAKPRIPLWTPGHAISLLHLTCKKQVNSTRRNLPLQG